MPPKGKMERVMLTRGDAMLFRGEVRVFRVFAVSCFSPIHTHTRTHTHTHTHTRIHTLTYKLLQAGSTRTTETLSPLVRGGVLVIFLSVTCW
jgi:hypothetical protein